MKGARPGVSGAQFPAAASPKQRAAQIAVGVILLLPAGTITWQEVASTIADAYREHDWEALGYGSWGAYVQGEFRERFTLSRDEKRQFAVHLRAAGVPLRAIGLFVGASHQTVANDLAEPATAPEPAEEARTGWELSQGPAVTRLTPERDAQARAAAEAFLSRLVFSTEDCEQLAGELRGPLGRPAALYADRQKEAAAGHQPAA